MSISKSGLMAAARAEAERRYGKARKLTGRRIAHDAFLFGAAWAYEWADAYPEAKPEAIVPDIDLRTSAGDS